MNLLGIEDDFTGSSVTTRYGLCSDAVEGGRGGVGISSIGTRYDRLRIARPEQERRLLSSLAEIGQQVPIVVVQDGRGEHFVVIGGYERVRSLRRLGRDTVASLCWSAAKRKPWW